MSLRSNGIRVALSLAAAMQLGCAHGFNRAELRAGLRAQTESQRAAKESPRAITAGEIRAARSPHPDMRFPISLAVYDAGGCGFDPRDSFSAVMKSEEQLKQRGVVSAIYFINSAVRKESDVKTARDAAREKGADALLYIRCAKESDRHLNGLAFFYVTLVGYFAIPGHTVDTLVMLDGTLWDVEEEYIHLGVESEATESLSAPGASINYKVPRNGAEQKALEIFTRSLVDRLMSLKHDSGS